MTPAGYALGTFSADGGAQFAGLVVGGYVLDLRGAFGPDVTTLALLDDWASVEPRLEALAATVGHEGPALESLHVHPPVASRQIFCAGANYGRHVREMATKIIGKARPELPPEHLAEVVENEIRQLADGDPFVFTSIPSALSGANDDIELRGGKVQHDWEVELTIVIGEGGQDIPISDARRHVAGYTVANDVSTRDAAQRPTPPMTDFLLHKNRRTYKPVGPYIVPASAVPSAEAMHLTLTVNGETMQDSRTDDLLNGIDKLIAFISGAAELYPGDLIMTGSPAGNAGHHGNRWLVPGDLVEASIDGIGTLRNRCVARLAA